MSFLFLVGNQKNWWDQITNHGKIMCTIPAIHHVLYRSVHPVIHLLQNYYIIIFVYYVFQIEFITIEKHNIMGAGHTMPMSARRREMASFTPSPVIPTTSPAQGCAATRPAGGGVDPNPQRHFAKAKFFDIKKEFFGLKTGAPADLAPKLAFGHTLRPYLPFFSFGLVLRMAR